MIGGKFRILINLLCLKLNYMKINIIYATNSGSTYEAAVAIQKGLEQTGKNEVKLITAATATIDDVAAANLVLLGSPTWFNKGAHGQLQETMEEFMNKIKGKIPEGKRFAMFGCGDKDFTFFCKAVDTMEEFAKVEGGEVITPGLKLENFFFKLNENYKLIDEWVKNLLLKI